MRFGAEVVVLLALLALDIAFAVSGGASCECACVCERGGARYLPLANAVVLAIVKPPAWGRVGGAGPEGSGGGGGASPD